MAASSATVGSILNIFCLFILFTAVTTNENTTNDNFNATLFGDKNSDYTTANYYTTTEPTVFEFTTSTTSSSSTEEPAAPAEPLPVSGRLLNPVTNVDRLCPCDEHKDVCDINCCCDKECRQEVALFTSCTVSMVSVSKQLCSHDVAYYSLRSTIEGYSELQLSVQKETNYDIFCIHSQNRVDGLSYVSPALPTENSFESLFKQFTNFIFGSENSAHVSPAELQDSLGYQYGDTVVMRGESGQRVFFCLPAPGVTADCVNSPSAFLKDQSNRCSQRMVLDQDCSSLSALSIDTYTNVQLFVGKNKHATVVPVEVASVILQSTDGSQTELEISGGENLSPFLLSPALCANVVLKVFFTIRYNPVGEIVNVTVSLLLGFVSDTMLPLEQEFQVMYVQEDGGEATVHYSGNPGYVAGLPLVSGTRTADGIARSINLGDTLSLLRSAEDQDCLQGPHQRSPVLFGLDSVSGCILRLEDTANCSLVSQLLLDILRGPNYPQFVASFGNSRLDSPLDWVQIKNNFYPWEAQSCNIPLSLHLEIEWTRYGSLVNPQAQLFLQSSNSLGNQVCLYVIQMWKHTGKGRGVWRKQHPADQNFCGLHTNISCCSSWLQSHTHHHCQITI
ncbi:tectonic-1 isoform X1 [Mugil cephalus]|uniref:tectonic-1 isoform X1 n=1 Tax=Mugil cephalus TaxID=48193 RepID=UPI001FB70B32|nr:tectonic-1 isoform X1 [Mugil cephalus]